MNSKKFSKKIKFFAVFMAFVLLGVWSISIINAPIVKAIDVVAAQTVELTNTSTFSATSIVKGDYIKMTGSAAGGTSPYQYAMVARHSTSSKWTVLKNYSTSNTYTWTPAKTGTYYVSIKVKDSSGTVVSKTQTIKVSETQLVNNSTVSATTVTKGSSIKFTCAASGGISPYQYSISARPTTSSTWTLLRDYSASNTYTWTPTQTGSYYVRVTVKDSTGATAVKTIGITVNTSDKTEKYINEVIRLVNVERQKRGLSTLIKRDDVCEIAAIRAKEIVISFSHTRPNGLSCFSLFDEYNIPYWTAGENIAYGYRTPAEVMEGWMNSEGHRANILNGNFDGIGVGCYEENGVLYWTQFFIG